MSHSDPSQTQATASSLAARLIQIEKFIGNTPLFPIRSVFKKRGVALYAKLEWNQLGGSVKSRAAFRIIKEAILAGEIDQDRGVLDASSGNTAIAYATIAKTLGIPVTICLPENTIPLRVTMLKALGAELVFTSGTTEDSRAKALEMSQSTGYQYYYTDQFSNAFNWLSHYETTAEEILTQTGGLITHFVAGMGTTGTFTGISKKLKEKLPALRTTALQPEGPDHGLEGWNYLDAVQTPSIYDPQQADEVMEVHTQDALAVIGKVAREEGLLLSPSSAANLVGSIRVAERLEEGVVVTTFADDATRYPGLLERYI